MIAYVTAGMKHGDLCSALPMLCEIYKQSGEKPVVIVSNEYKTLVEDCQLVEADVWDGEWHNLKGALKYAKKKYRRVINLSTFGLDFPIEQRFTGFQLDQWDRGGMVNSFGKLPLEIKSTHKPEKTYDVLVADASESSGFEKSNELRALVMAACPNASIGYLSDIKLNRVSDLIALYDKAKALITIDTVHAHLSAASSVPVFAFVTDKPTPWHGSSFQKRFHFHCRYDDFGRRKGEFLHQLTRVMQGKSRPKIIEIEGLKDAYNPSIIEHNGELLMSYRWHADGTAMSKPGMAELDKDFKVFKNADVRLPDSIARYALEDGRLFKHRGALWMSYTMAAFPMPPFRCAVGYGRLEKVDGIWTLLDDFRPKYGKNDFTGMQKNWLFHSCDDRLYFFYGDGLVCEVEGDKVVKEHKSNILPWSYGIPRGGAIIPWKGKLLRFFHARTDDSAKPCFWHYRISACLHDAKPPFAMTSINPNPIISGDEEWFSAKLFKPKVAICFGCVRIGSKFYLSYGKNDCQSLIMELDENQIEL